MKNQIVPEKKKIPGLSYAVMSDRIELPVLDITHPLFNSSINENKLAGYLIEAEKNGEKRARSFQNVPAFIKRFFINHSFIMADLLSEKKEDNFLSGLSTLLLKMGPDLIGGGAKRFLDRLSSKGIGGIVLRMRLRDMAHCQAEILSPLLNSSPEKNLCLINIAGGTSCDSINSLLLILKEKPELLQNRNIEINVLDIDPTGPDFAAKSIDALKTGDGKFRNLNITLKYIPYNWNDTRELIKLLLTRKDWLMLCGSEGGLFEYCEDEVIIANLAALYENSPKDMIIAGSIMRDVGTIDAGAKAAMKITSIKARMVGIDGLKILLEKTKWKLDRLMETNPRYIVFSLIKRDALNY
ncbi:MAG: hypothetical protein WCS03_03720 [Bacteroidota bacterium]